MLKYLFNAGLDQIKGVNRLKMQKEYNILASTADKANSNFRVY